MVPFCTVESQFVNRRSINNVSHFIIGVNMHFPLKIENADRRFLVFKCIDDAKGNFISFAELNCQFEEMFSNQLFSYFKDEIEVAHFTPWIMHETDIKIEMMNDCKESWLLFFETKIEKFTKGHEIKKAYAD
jgi:hypothetical protein